MKKRTTYFLATILLLFTLSLSFFSMLGNSGTFDEVSHIPAGYSYITQADMRSNPEHPPLIKDLAGISILIASKIKGINLNFPDQGSGWNNPSLNERQWEYGNDFLYRSGNPADFIFLAGRLPMLSILLILGIYIFIWARQLWGNKAALLALSLFSFSPTFIAHSEFVTTDVAAAAGVFISAFYFIKWLKKPSLANLIFAAVALGLAELAKFSLILLLPFFLLLLIIWSIAKISEKKENWPKILFTHFAGFVLIIFLSYGFIIIPVYYFHIKNYPVQKQISDMRNVLEYQNAGQDPFAACKSKDLQKIKKCPTEAAIWLADKPNVARGFGQYLLGMIMIFRRASGGNTTYFFGEISAQGWHSYFPLMYLFKEQLALHLMTLLAIILAAGRLFRRKTEEQNRNLAQKPKARIAWFGKNFEIAAFLIFIFIYWYSSISSRLNIGVRHVLPTFPFIYLLVSSEMTKWLNRNNLLKFLKYGTITALLLWQAVSVIAAYPSFLAYYNRLAGGPSNGHKIAVDSNLDWGQDLFRLKFWADENRIGKIYIDYFGGGSPKQVFGENFQGWWGSRNPSDLRSGDWLAISATLLMGGQGKAAPGYNSKTDYYEWLKAYEPKSIIGHSIFVFQKP